MSTRSHVHIPFALLVASFAGCNWVLNYKDDPNHCAGLPHDNCLNDGGPMSCQSDQDCTGDATVCDVSPGVMTCVQCMPARNEACGGATPACIDNACRPCTAHGQCDSQVCLIDDGGTCAASSEVAYVDPNGTDNASCTMPAPCTKIAKALTTSRPYVKLTGTFDEAVSISDQNVSLLADPGARLTRTQNGLILEIKGTSRVTISDLEISGGSGAQGIGISIPSGSSASLSVVRSTISANHGGGIVSSGGSLSIVRSTISANHGGGIVSSGGSLSIARSTISANHGGGIAVTGVTAFSIMDNFVIYNGRALGAQPSTNGGVAIISNTSGSRLERNTIAFNESDGVTFRGGVSCNAPLSNAASNLIFHNTESDGIGGTRTNATTQMNATGGCPYGNSLSIAADPANLGFKSPLVAPFDFHLTASSPASIVDAGGPCMGEDFDGDRRPLGTACDLGADELRK